MRVEDIEDIDRLWGVADQQEGVLNITCSEGVEGVGKVFESASKITKIFFASDGWASMEFSGRVGEEGDEIRRAQFIFAQNVGNQRDECWTIGLVFVGGGEARLYLGDPVENARVREALFDAISSSGHGSSSLRRFPYLAREMDAWLKVIESAIGDTPQLARGGGACFMGPRCSIFVGGR